MNENKPITTPTPALKLYYQTLREEGASMLDALGTTTTFAQKSLKKMQQDKKDREKLPILVPDQPDDRFPTTNL